MAKQETLVVESTNLFHQKGVYDTETRPRVYRVDSIVTGTLYDATGTTPIAGAIAIPMPYVPGTTGRSTEYRGVLPASVPLVIGTHYLLKVTYTDIYGDVRVFQKDQLAIRG